MPAEARKIQAMDEAVKESLVTSVITACSLIVSHPANHAMITHTAVPERKGLAGVGDYMQVHLANHS